jgi:NTP pyrophosphatase (non-canonical NTP hydrolase)
MNFNQYQKEARKTNLYPIISRSVALVFGLCEEAGEVAGKFKKYFRGDLDSTTDPVGVLREQMLAELGDVLWYVSQIADDMGLSLDKVAEYNITKLKDRQKRNKIKGSGDVR